MIYLILPNVLLLDRAVMRFATPLSENFDPPNLKFVERSK